MTDLWVLTYIGSRVTPTGTRPQSPRTSDNVDDLTEALQGIYGECAVQRAGVGRLLLRGPRAKVLEIKRILALIDAPWPQVQMSMWAVQVTGPPPEVSRRIAQIGERIGTIRDQMQAVQRELARLVVDDRASNGKHWGVLERGFALAGIDFPLGVPLSLNESLILLTLHPQRARKVKDLQSFVERQRSRWTQDWRSAELSPTPSYRSKPAFVRLETLVAETSAAADLEAFRRFGVSLYCFKDQMKWVDRPDAPHSLARTGAVVDRVLKSVMDAFAADMADLFLDPLLEELQASTSGEATSRRNEAGIALVGRTRIVVTSGLEAGLAPEMASFVESSVPRPFGKELLDAAFPASESGADSTAGVLTGAQKVLAGLSGGQALALAALLSAETEPAYTKVAPGIAVNVRPSVLPDGGAARLTIDARFGVESEPLDSDRTDVWRQAPPAGIKSHNVRTDAAVSAFDLFDISSFSVTASHPQTPYFVPILARLPLIGKAFQYPRPNKETLFESIILVNAVILPRSLELHRFYGRSVDPAWPPFPADAADREQEKPPDCWDEEDPAAAVEKPQAG